MSTVRAFLHVSAVTDSGEVAKQSIASSCLACIETINSSPLDNSYWINCLCEEALSLMTNQDTEALWKMNIKNTAFTYARTLFQ